MFSKLYPSIFDGSLYGDFPATVVMMAMIALANRHGEIDMTPQSLSARTGFPLDIIERGIDSLSKPDPRSRSKAESGRRIVLLDHERPWGWRLVNYQKYRAIKSEEERREYQRVLMAKRRALKGEEAVSSVSSVSDSAPWSDDENVSNSVSNVSNVSNVSSRLALLAHAEADAEADAEAIPPASTSNLSNTSTHRRGGAGGHLELRPRNRPKIRKS